MGGENLIGEEIDGKRTEGKDRGVKGETQPNHKPIRGIESKKVFKSLPDLNDGLPERQSTDAKTLPELDLVDRTGLSQLVAAFGSAFEPPVNCRADDGQHSGTDGDQ